MKKLLLGSLALVLVLGGCAGAAKEYNDSQRFPETTMAAVDEIYFEREAVSSHDTASTEKYLEIEQNAVTQAKEQPLISFSLKVDTASYNNVQRYIKSGNLPPADAVRTEELINYFNYDETVYPTDSPFSVYCELGESPFQADKTLAFIRVKTDDVDKEELPDSNLTFLIDTSGSMDSFDKLPLLKSAFQLLVNTLDENDKVSIVTYAGSSQVVLDSVSGADKATIINAIEHLSASGSTAGADGINTAYALAEKNFKEGGNNRIILASDGDFNVGISSLGALEDLIASKREQGIYFSVLGFGTGNLKDDTMETLATHGNGNYSYIDSVSSAKKVLVDEMGSNLFTVADDVKAQLEFNPKIIKSYRLIGYENRKMSQEEFQDDQKDAGEIGVGTDVVILVELEFVEDTLDFHDTDDFFKLQIRYKDPGEKESKEMVQLINSKYFRTDNSSDFKFAASVAMFGEMLRDSEYHDDVSVNDLIYMVQQNLGADEHKYRIEFLEELIEYQRIVNNVAR